MAYEFVEYPTVDLVSRALTTMSISVDEVNGRMLLTASNNQQKGYTEGGDKTVSQYVSLSITKPAISANGDITAIARMSAGADNMIMRESSKLSLGANTADNLTVNGPEVTADAGYYPSAVKKSVTTVNRGVPLIGVNRTTRKITARVSQPAGYVSYGVENAEINIPSYLVDVESITKSSDDLVVDGATITTPAGYYPFDSSKSVNKVEMAEPTVNVDADDEESEIIIVSINNQQTGYAEANPAPQSPPFVQSFVKLSIDGNKAIMSCGNAKIERTVGASIATCTVNVTFSTNAGNTLISATTFANGAISTVNHNIGNNNNGKSVSIPNVVCGSALSINTSANRASLYWSGSMVGHYGLQGGTIIVPSATGTYSVEIGVLDD